MIRNNKIITEKILINNSNRNRAAYTYDATLALH